MQFIYSDINRLIIDYLPIAAKLCLYLTAKQFHDMVLPTNCEEIIAEVIEMGSVNIIEYLIRTLNYILPDDICELTSKYGHLHLLKWLRTNEILEYYAWDNSIFYKALKYGHLNIIEWLHENNFFSDNDPFVTKFRQDFACEEAAKSGNIESIKWLRNHDYSWSSIPIYNAARYQHFNLVKWLTENGFDCENGCYLLSGIAHTGNLELLKYYYKLGFPLHEFAFSGAASSGNLDMCKWLHKNFCSYDVAVCNNAAKYGHFKILKWLLKNGYWISDNICSYAAISGNIDILKWCISKGYIVEIDVLYKAAKYNHTELLKWILTNNIINFDQKAYQGAIAGGHIDMIIWLQSQGYTFIKNIESYRKAAHYGHIHMLKWLGKSDIIDTTVCREAMRGNQFKTLKWLYKNKYPWDEQTSNRAARDGNLRILKWLKKNNCPFNEQVCYGLVHNNLSVHLDCYVWAIKNNCPCNEETKQAAIKRWPELLTI